MFSSGLRRVYYNAVRLKCTRTVRRTVFLNKQEVYAYFEPMQKLV